MSGNAGAGPSDGKLRPCPESPNCVCSEFTGTGHSIEPFAFGGDAGEAWARLLGIVAAQPRVTIVDRNEGYIQARLRTRIFRFEDVLEFRLDQATGQIHVRSASEVGYTDLGVNRRRVEAIRSRFLAVTPDTV